MYSLYTYLTELSAALNNTELKSISTKKALELHEKVAECAAHEKLGDVISTMEVIGKRWTKQKTVKVETLLALIGRLMPMAPTHNPVAPVQQTQRTAPGGAYKGFIDFEVNGVTKRVFNVWQKSDDMLIKFKLGTVGNDKRCVDSVAYKFWRNDISKNYIRLCHYELQRNGSPKIDNRGQKVETVWIHKDITKQLFSVVQQIINGDGQQS